MSIAGRFVKEKMFARSILPYAEIEAKNFRRKVQNHSLKLEIRQVLHQCLGNDSSFYVLCLF